MPTLLDRDAPLNSSPTALEASRIINRPCTLFSYTVLNNGESAIYVQLFDAVSLPEEGAVPNADIWKVLPGEVGGYDYGTAGKRFSQGITIVLSSTAATKTITGNVGLIFARFRHSTRI